MKGTILAVASLAAVAHLAAQASPLPFSSIRRALVAIAHPDDAETIAGGLIASLIHEYNVSVAYVVSTLGQAGWHSSYNVTRDYVGEVRRQEQLNAAAVMGVEEVFFLDQQDGFLEGVDPVQLKVNLSRVIRIWQPDVLITFDQNPDYSQFQFGNIHRDHLTTGRAALDAAYPMARDWLAAPSLWPQYPTWDTPQVWLFSWSQVSNADLVIDIGPWLDLKYNALLQHVSQYTNASQVYQDLVNLGQLVAAKNNAAAGSIAEAYTVVEIF